MNATATVTNAQIAKFATEAGAAGDLKAAARARQALAGNKAARKDVASWIAEAAAN